MRFSRTASSGPRCVRVLLTTALGLPLGVLFAGFASAQTEKPEFANVFQPAPSDVRKPLMRAEKAIQEGRYSDAAFDLGRLLTTEDTELAEAQDYFLIDEEGEQTGEAASLKGKIQQMLAGLPPEGRQSYELQYGAQARALLDAALSEGNMDKLADVIRRFLHTQAGYEASILAGRYELGCGRPTAAALHLQRVAGTPHAAARFEPELSFLLATCWLYADMPDKARQTLIAMRQRAGGDSIQVGDKTVALFRSDEEALPWFDNLIGLRQPLLSPELTEWVVHRGNPQRNGRTQGSLPLLNYRWRVPTCIDRSDEKMVEKLGKQYRDEGRAVLPVMQPLAVGDTVLMRTPHKLLGVDFASGKRIWVWPPWESDVADGWSGGAGNEQILAAGREQEVQQRIWDDAAHGQLSCDGESVFLIHDLGFAAAGSYTPQRIVIAQGGIAMRYPGAARSNNQLVSLSLARQGAAQWIVGGDTGEDEPKLAGGFFLGAPLPLRGRLYAMAEFNGEIRLVVLDAKYGRLIWQQQLAHVDARTIENDAVRRLAGAVPSYEGGVLLCPTSAGALVAVDVATRSLLWGYQYVKLPEQPQNRGFGIIQLTRRNMQPPGSRWADATVTVVDGRVLLTPADTDDFHCLDLLTGKPVWAPQPRGDRLYVACVHQGRIVFVGPEEVSAVQLADGQPAWANPIRLTDPPSGRGFYSDHFYFLPTAGSELLKIDLNTGEIALRSQTSLMLGNLVCYRDEILSHGPDWLSIFYQSEPLRRRVEDALARNPADTDAMARYGELLLAQGKRDEAIQTLREVCRLQPENETAKNLLVDTLMAALEEDFQGRLDTVDEIRSLVQHPRQSSRLLRLLAGGWQAQGEVAKAFDAYLDLAGLKDELLQQTSAYEREAEEVQRHWSCRTERWLQSRFGELLAAANAGQREAMETTIRQWRDAALSDGETSSLRRFLRYFGAHPWADQVRLQLAERLVQTGELAEAELLLSQLEQHSDADLQRQAAARMAALLVDGRQFDEALQYYLALAKRWGDVVCRDGKTGRQLCDEAVQQSELKAAAARAEPWPRGQVEVAESADQVNRYPSYRRVFSCQVQQRTGAAPAGMRVFYDQQPNTLIIRDGHGNTIQTINLGSRRLNTSDFSLTHVRFHGHLMVVSMGMELLAVDLMQAARNPSAPILWRKELVRPAPGTSVYQTSLKVQALKHPWGDNRRVFADADKHLLGVTGPLTHRGFFYFNLRELICADPVTGDTIWSRANLPHGSDVFGDHELIFVVPPLSQEAQVFSAIDGQDLGTREVDELDYRWATCGRNVLAWSQQDATSPLTLRLYDAWTGEDLWREVVPADSKATLVEDDEVALLQADGRFLVRSLKDAAIPVQAQVNAEEGLLSLYVIRSAEQYLLVTNRTVSVEPNTPAATIRSIVSGSATPLVTGHVYAFDRRSGQSMWGEPAKVDRYGFPVDQPGELPLVLFLRHYRPDSDRGNPAQHTAVLALDRHDGRQVMEKGDIPAQTYTYDVMADRLKQTITIGLPAKTITLTLTDKPRSQPPAEAEKEPGAEPASGEAAAKPDPAAKADPSAKADPAAGPKPPAAAPEAADLFAPAPR